MDSSASNHLAYGSPEAVAFYAAYSEIPTPEQALFTSYADHLSGRVLDLGVGGGRTTAVLAPTAAHYVGIDYVPALIDAARQRCLGVDLRVGDARDLSDFGDESFDAVVFSFNGMDYVPHEDRAQVLREVRRVLAPGGVFVFSTHNLDVEQPIKAPRLSRPRLRRSWLRSAVRFPATAMRHRRMQRQQQYGDGWALLNDEGHDYQLLTHYTTQARQQQELAESGLEVECCLAHDANPAPAMDRVSYCLHYAARPSVT